MELGKLILKEGRVEIASSISTDQSKINTVSLVLEYIPSTISSSSSSSSSTSSSSTTSQSSTSTLLIASSLSERKEERVTDGVHIERKVDTSTGMDELKAMLKEERRKAEEEKRKMGELERQLSKLRDDMSRMQIPNSVRSIPSERKEIRVEGAMETSIPKTTFRQPETPNGGYVAPDSYYPSYISHLPVQEYCPAAPIQQYVTLTYNPHHDSTLYPEGVKYTLKYGGRYKKESASVIERMLVYFLLGEGNLVGLPGISMTLTMTEQQMLDGYKTDYPRAMALARVAYSVHLLNETASEKNALQYLPGRARCVTTHTAIFGILETFCCHMGYYLKRKKSSFKILYREYQPVYYPQ